MLALTRQKIRTIELDGKTVKLQIVSSTPHVPFRLLTLDSGTQLGRNASEQLPPLTTAVLMESL